MTIAAQSAPTQPDEATRAALIQNLSGAQIVAVSQAVANLNAITNACTNATCVETSQYYSETQVGNSFHTSSPQHSIALLGCLTRHRCKGSLLLSYLPCLWQRAPI
jgi:hypothetical protein